MKTYRVVHNGVSCLVAPCFSWDVTDKESGDKKAVSAVAMREKPDAGAVANKTRDDIIMGKVYVHGYFEPYTVDKPVSGEGIRFVVSDVIGSVD